MSPPLTPLPRSSCRCSRRTEAQERLLMLLLGCLFTLPAAIASNSVPIPIYMDEMLNAGRLVYDKQSTPTQNQGVPTQVNLSMYIEGLSSFRTQTMDFQLDVYFQQFWVDKRLQHNESKRILVRDKDFLNKIWHPDIYFANARIAEFHEVTQPNFLLWLEPDGSILYDCRISMTVICTMYLAKWPLDDQRCHLRVLSYAYDINQLLISWNEVEPITRNQRIQMSDMQIVRLGPGLCDGNYSTGIWSCVTAEFYVQREITHHIMQSYVPTSLIVVISWFSFWIDVEAVPARVSLAITTLLTLSTQASTARMALPEVSYAKAIDVWSSTCMLFVFGVMIEFTICNFVQRQAMQAETNKQSTKNKDGSPSPKLGARARSFIGKAMGRSGEAKLLIESSVDDYGTPRRHHSVAYDNEALDCSGTGVATASGKKMPQLRENGRPISMGPLLKTPQDARWREREAERLANWSNVSVETGEAAVPTTTPTARKESLWNRVKSITPDRPSDVEKDANGEEVVKHKLTKVVGIGEKWTMALKQMQRNKKMRARNEAKKIDQISRWSFPLAFCLFNLTYWTYYLYIA